MIIARKAIAAAGAAIIAAAPVLAADSGYYTGNGGKELSISVEKPNVQNVGEDVSWLVDYANNVISDDIKKYSQVEVVERRYERAISGALAKEEGGAYEEDGVEIGNFKAAKSQLQVTIIGKERSYNISVAVIDKATLTSQASFNRDCGYDELESGAVLKEAVADILGQMGIVLTAKAKSELLKAEESDSSIAAQKLVARSRQAEERGSNVEALRLVMEATRTDSSLRRAHQVRTQLSHQISAQIQSGDFGAKARDMIKRRKEYISLIDELRLIVDETKAHYIDNPPFRFVYDTGMKQEGIDYDNETYKVSFNAAMVVDDCIDEDYRIIKDMYDALYAEPLRTEWSRGSTWKGWPDIMSIFPAANVLAVIDIADKSGNVISTAEASFSMNSGDEAMDHETFHAVIPSSADTSVIRMTIKSISIGGKEIKADALEVKDYINEAMTKYFVPNESGVEGIYVMAVQLRSWSTMKGAFALPSPQSVTVDGKKYVRLEENDIILSSSEESVLRNKGIKYAAHWTVEDDALFPRSRKKFLAAPFNYVRIKLLTLGSSGARFVALDKEQARLLEIGFGVGEGSVAYRSHNTKYTYYPVPSGTLGAVFGGFLADALEKMTDKKVYDSSNGAQSVCAYSADWSDVFAILQKRWSNCKALPYDNSFYTDNSGATSGKECAELLDFVSYCNSKDRDNSIILMPYYFESGPYISTTTVMERALMEKQQAIDDAKRKAEAAKRAEERAAQLAKEKEERERYLIEHADEIRAEEEKARAKEEKLATFREDAAKLGFGALIYNDGACITSAPQGGESTLNIPASIGGLPVTAIGEEAFRNNNKIEKVFLPDTVEWIGARAFMNCTSLKAINLPISIKRIGDEAFYDCTSLTDVTLASNASIKFENYGKCKTFYKCSKIAKDCKKALKKAGYTGSF